MNLTLFFAFFLPSYLAGKKSSQWPQTEGKIISSVVKSKFYEGSSRSSAHWEHKALIRFEYIIDGAFYESDRIGFGSGEIYGDKAVPESVVSKYPVGKKVAVIYSPEDHKFAALEAGIHPMEIQFFYGTLVFGILGSFYFIYSLSRVITFARKTVSLSHDFKGDPRESQWVVQVSADKMDGPYSYEQVLEMHTKGTINRETICMPVMSTGKGALIPIKLEKILYRKAS